MFWSNKENFTDNLCCDLERCSNDEEKKVTLLKALKEVIDDEKLNQKLSRVYFNLSEPTQNDKIKSVSDFLEKIKEINYSINPDFFKKTDFVWYRGENEIYNTPLLDGLKRNRGKYSTHECEIYYNFRLKAHDLILPHFSDFDILQLMQHYGLPTRLLDWTSNPLIALFFATVNLSELSKANNKDGKVFMLYPSELNAKLNRGSILLTPDSIEVKIRATLTKFEKLSEKDIKDEILNIEPRLKSEEIEQIFNNLSKPIAVIPIRNNERLKLQSGNFTLNGVKALGKDYNNNTLYMNNNSGDFFPYIEDKNSNIIREVVIDKNSKRYILDELNSLGINESTIFPELEHQCNYIKHKLIDNINPA